MFAAAPPFLNGFVTVMPPALLKRMVVLPVNRYADCAAATSFAFVGGIFSGSVPDASGVENTGEPAQARPPRLAQPGDGPETSMVSAAERPKTAGPQVWMSSFVWKGPLILSKFQKVISSQASGREARGSLQLLAAHALFGVPVVGYAAGSSVSKSVKYR